MKTEDASLSKNLIKLSRHNLYTPTYIRLDTFTKIERV